MTIGQWLSLIFTIDNILWFIVGLAGTLLLITIWEVFIRWKRQKKRI
jgi:hypothetical protein